MRLFDRVKKLPTKSIDLVITDPPYELQTRGAGIFKKKDSPEVMTKIKEIASGFDYISVFKELVRVLKKINIYLFCSQAQILPYLKFFVEECKCNYDLLCWHKTNPLPTCNNKYLSDTEYLLFFREKGVKLYGNFNTKKKYFITALNNVEAIKIGHPTVKPLSIIRTLLINSSVENDIVLDPFLGSGTTAIAAIKEKRCYLGYEINEKYFNIAKKRIENEQRQLTINI